MDHYDPDELLSHLDDEQREVARHPLGPMCVRAGAGTGKTRAITYRIAYGVATNVYAPTNVLAVTFTSRAAAEMRERLRMLGVGTVQARTFHAAALSQLRYFWETAVGGQMPELLRSKIRHVHAAAGRLGVATDSDTLRDIAQEIEWAAVSLVGEEEYPAAIATHARQVPAGLDAATMARLLGVYQDTKAEHGVIDFEDVLTLTCGMLEQREDIAAQVRGQYRYFVVDEYQDVSPLQAHLLSLWVGGRCDVCVVGDAAQTIYSFAGATQRYLTEFTQTYPQARVVELVRDYRSTPQIVSLANHVLSRASDTRGVHLCSQVESGPAVQFHAYGDDEEEAAEVAREIATLIRSGVRPRDIAILYRINAQSEPFEAALSEAGIGYVVRGNQRFFDRDEVRRSLLRLRGLLAVSATSTQLGDIMRATVEEFGWTPTAPQAQGAARDRWNYLNTLVEMAQAREQADVTLAEFVQDLRERADSQAGLVIDGVTLSSLHAAKGLEWEAVFLVGASDGLLPLKQVGADRAAIEEELRLTYVGVTRAKRHLRLSYARSRNPGQRQKRQPTRFLSKVWPEIGRPGRKSPRRSAPSATQFRAKANPADVELYDRLCQWRLLVAEHLGKPAYIVATNTTLAAIAEAHPSTLKHLGMLPGIGEARIRAFGAAILSVCQGGDLETQAARAAAEWQDRREEREMLG